MVSKTQTHTETKEREMLIRDERTAEKTHKIRMNQSYTKKTDTFKIILILNNQISK